MKKDPKKNIDKHLEERHNDDDLIFEEEEIGPADTIKRLREKLRVCQKEKHEYLDGWQRSKADYLNSKKQDADRLSALRGGVLLEYIEALLPVLDSFHMAFANTTIWNQVDQNWRTGIEHIYSQCMRILEDNGVTEINPTGKPFDPLVHESIEMVEVDNKKQSGIVLEVAQRGYETKDFVIRAPKVKVGNFTE